VADDREARMRASDHEREEVVAILRDALNDGRLKMEEYVERMGQAYDAVTIGDLALLHDDLPATRAVARPDSGAGSSTVTPASTAAVPGAVPATAAAEPLTGWHAAYADLPAALKVLWTIWFAAVSINVVVWVLVGVTSGSVPYPWPLWVAGPYGAALFGVSAPVVKARRARRGRPKPPRQGS
jgi:hypothetical protein